MRHSPDTNTNPSNPDASSRVHDPRESPTQPAVFFGPMGATRIGKYKLLRQIGSGGMGVVYEALQEGTDQHVAIKLIRPESVTESRLRRFETEVKVLGKLRHPNIAQVFDASIDIASSTESFPFIVMEYIAGGVPITSFARDRRLGPADKIRLFLPVCDALHTAHTQSVVHRDIKPSNILVEPLESAASRTAHESIGRVKVIDFGIARVISPGDDDNDPHNRATHTVEGELMGTVRYMSPEQTLGLHHLVDARSDIYALGVVLHELLTGMLPYQSDKARTEIAARIIQEQPPTPAGQIDATLAGDLETIILKCLSKERDRRYQSAAELAEDLRRYLAGEPVVARRDSTLYRVRRGLGRLFARHPIIAVAVGALAAIITVATLVQPWAFDWTNHARSYAKLLRKTAPPIPVTAPITHCVLIHVTDSTDMAQVAASLGLNGVTDSHRANLGNPDSPEARAERRNWRAVYAALLTALADTRAKGVVFDIILAGASDADNAFADAAKLFRERNGTDITVALPSWDHAFNQSLVSPRLMDAVRSGPALMLENDTHPNAMAWVREQPNGVRTPSMSLTALAAYHRPGLNFLLDYELDGTWITYLAPGVPINDPDARLGPPQPLGMAGSLGAKFKCSVFKPDPNGLDPTDSIGVSDLWIPLASEFDKVSYEIGSVLAMPPTQRRALFDGKLVLVANTRTGVDRPTIVDASGVNMIIPGCWTHLSALDRAIADGPSWVAGQNRWSALVIIPALFAAELARRAARRPKLLFLTISSLTLLCMLTGLILFFTQRGLFYSTGTIAAIWLAALITASLLQFRPPALASTALPDPKGFS